MFLHFFKNVIMELSVVKSKHNFYTIIRVLVFLFVISAFVTFLFVGKDIFISFKKYFDGIIYGFFVGLSFWLGNWAIGWFTGTRINWRKNPKRANIISLLMFILYGIIASITVPWVYHGVFHKYSDNLLNTVVINGFINLSVDVIFVSIYYSKYLVMYYAQSLINEEELKRETLAAKYEALKSQVNPHFLFNSLNTLTGVVENNPEKAVEFIKKLSDIYRYVLEQRDKELIPAGDELKFVEDYMHLAGIRYGEGLSLSIKGKKDNIQVAPLGLQILVENAIKHNIISDDMPLKIEIDINERFIAVKNNVQKKSSLANASNGMGLENLKHRYKYLSDIPVEVIAGDNLFIVKLPVIENSVL
jgi:sensor histidine kinase YesM